MKKIVSCLLIILILTGCDKKIFETNLFYMDTVIQIKLEKVSEKKAKEAFSKIEKLFQKYHMIVDDYNEDSELYQVNHSMGEKIISDELAYFIEEGKNWYVKSDGLLNINIGSLTHLWHDVREGIKPFPTQETLDLINLDINSIKLQGNILQTNENVHIDLGSIAKGYVTEMAGKLLEEMGIEYYLINAGGNVKVGKSTKGYYAIGVASPIDNSNIKIIKGQNISVVTSGGYERFFEYNGTSYHHLLNPITKYPADYMKSVTVIGNDSGLCDALSTILFLMPIEEGKRFIKDYNINVIWYSNDNEIIVNEGFIYE